MKLIESPRLQTITLHVFMTGEAWGGFIAERDSMARYAPSQWPGLKTAIARLCDWPDCIRDTVRPSAACLEYEFANDHGHRQTIVRELDRFDV